MPCGEFFVDPFCDGWRSCRGRFDASNRECLVCFATTTLMKEGRDDEANDAKMAWALDFGKHV